MTCVHRRVIPASRRLRRSPARDDAASSKSILYSTFIISTLSILSPPPGSFPPPPFHSLSRPQDEMNWSPDQGEGFAELVLEIAAVGEMQRLVDVGEKRDRRRLAFELRGVVEAARLFPSPLAAVTAYRLLENLIQLRGAEAAPVAVGDPSIVGKIFSTLRPLFAEMNSSGA